MNIQQMRVFIAEHPRYKNGASWRAKCMTMSDRQVVAIYNKFRKLDYNEIRKEVNEPKKEMYHQIDIFEYLIGKEEA